MERGQHAARDRGAAVSLTAAVAPGDAQDPLPANYYGGGLFRDAEVTA